MISNVTLPQANNNAPAISASFPGEMPFLTCVLRTGASGSSYQIYVVSAVLVLGLGNGSGSGADRALNGGAALAFGTAAEWASTTGFFGSFSRPMALPSTY